MKYDAQPLGWVVVEDVFNAAHIAKCESIFAQGNGYMNLRNALEENYVGQRRGAFVTGTFNKALPDEVTELPNLPDVTELRLTVNGERFSMETGTVEDYRRQLDLCTGEAERTLLWTSPGGARLALRLRRFVSLAQEHLAAFCAEITALDGPADLVLESGIDSRVSNTGSQHCTEGEKRLVDGSILQLACRTCQSDIPVVVHCAHRFSQKPAHSLPVMERRRFVQRFAFHLGAGATLRMDKFACYCTGRDLPFVAFGQQNGVEEPEPVIAEGLETLRRALTRDYDALLADSAARWAQYWEKTDVRVDSPDPMDQLGLRFALYHLNIMVKRDDSRVGIGAKGMTGEGYKGHSFWDTEMFLLPHYLLTDPAAARTLLEYRWRSLPGAFKKARENNWQGAMFPWESAWLTDGEVTPLFGAADVVTGQSIPILTGMLEHHITADVAWAVWLYYTATGDDDFMEKCGCELLVATACFWASRLEWKSGTGRYEICNVIGPDEYKEHVDNNAFTNYLAAENLRVASLVIGRMRRDWPAAWAALSARHDLPALAAEFDEKREKMYLPAPRPGDGLVPQNDQYLNLEPVDLARYKAQAGVSSIYEDYSPAQMNRLMVSKQADLVMLLRVIPGLFDPETRRKNFLFYESRTLHDSSLSHGQHCVLAAWMGLDGMALDLYRHAAAIDLGPNPTSSDEGIHSASMGNVWQCAVCGFAGLRWEGGQLMLENHLPASWKSLEFTVEWRGARLAVRLSHEKGIQVRRLGGTAITILVDGVPVTPNAAEEDA
ncbi:glycoside hydrolase family 65 protein [Candidatus Allofournierella merdavium]|uniref:glycoside hydrolase family 65 protein n=1 Tax=Candidatus Allofournierella merdavium TaxID=2838593 RepID=UPI00374FA2C7